MSCPDYILRREVCRGADGQDYYTEHWVCNGYHGQDAGISEYCRSSGYIYCPRRDGDDRYRRSDVLTEEMSYTILRAVLNCVERGRTAMKNALSELYVAVLRIGYEPLAYEFLQAGRRPFRTPRVYGYASIVPSLMERRQADFLTVEIEKELAGFQPANLMPLISTAGGRLDVSSQDFGYLHSILSSVSYSVSSAINGCLPIPGCAHLGGPAEQAIRELADEAASYLQGFADYFFQAQSQFEAGVRHTLESAGYSTYGYSGRLPEWR